MNVIDGLAAHFIAVHHHSEAVLATLLLGQALCGEQDMSGQGLVVLGEVVEGADGFFGMTRKCTGACGAMSWKARTWSSS